MSRDTRLQLLLSGKANAECSSTAYQVMHQSLPTSLTEIVLLERRATWFSLLSQYSFEARQRVDGPPLGLRLARASRQLKHLSATSFVDTKNFFQPFWPQPSTVRTRNSKEWAWSRLQTLAITSWPLDGPYHPEQEVNHLLEAVSVAVRRMPSYERWRCGAATAMIMHVYFASASARTPQESRPLGKVPGRSLSRNARRALGPKQCSKGQTFIAQSKSRSW
jgi:hypothetical protein